MWDGQSRDRRNTLRTGVKCYRLWYLDVVHVQLIRHGDAQCLRWQSQRHGVVRCIFHARYAVSACGRRPCPRALYRRPIRRRRRWYVLCLFHNNQVEHRRASGPRQLVQRTKVDVRTEAWWARRTCTRCTRGSRVAGTLCPKVLIAVTDRTPHNLSVIATRILAATFAFSRGTWPTF